ncbi:MAG TPA: hypothetical protein VHZ07_20920 [Bryobacteraceae bacterium]|jgi:hypothetical protein|nr:hypothetical protein [Bryobacteraceae bacterium]
MMGQFTRGLKKGLSAKSAGRPLDIRNACNVPAVRDFATPWDLDTPLLRISARDYFTNRSAFGGIHGFGGIGSGKTSGLGRMLAGAFLRAGYGGLVTAVKPEELELWRRYCAEHGRAGSLIVFDENAGFNFLAYELGRQGMNGIGTVVECLMRILEAAKRASPTASQKGGEPFWEDATRQLLRYALPPLYAAHGKVTVPDIIDFISSAPSTAEEVTSAEWQRGSFMYRVMDTAARRPRIPMDAAAMRDALNYWSSQFPRIPEKTRGNIVISVSTALDRFKRGRLQRAFCSKTSIVPEMCFSGAVILLAMPTLTWNEDGAIAQVLFKYMWQRCVLSRNSLEEKHRERPLFQYSDEAQETVSSYDGEFLGMCRGSNCAVASMTQSLPAYFSKIGGDNPRDAAMNLAGKYMTHVYFSNGCAETNEFAAKTCGRVMKRHANYSAGENHGTSYGMNYGTGSNSGSSSSWGNGILPGNTTTNKGSSDNWGENRGQSRGTSTSRGYSESMEYAIEPGDFGRCFKTGGAANNYQVTGIWYRSGETFKASGGNILPVTFSQK